MGFPTDQVVAQAIQSFRKAPAVHWKIWIVLKAVVQRKLAIDQISSLQVKVYPLIPHLPGCFW